MTAEDLKISIKDCISLRLHLYNLPERGEKRAKPMGGLTQLSSIFRINHILFMKYTTKQIKEKVFRRDC